MAERAPGASPLADDGGLTDTERALSLRRGDFPFRSRFVDVLGARLHYIDEGAGRTVLMVHGNPTWSFLFRHMVADLSRDHRCIAIDLPGFGRSEPPPGFGHRPQEHAKVVAAFVRALDLTDITLAAHDWGGPISLAALAVERERFTRVCLGNSWAWPVNGDLHFEWFSRLLGGAAGRWLARRYLVFVNVVMPSAMRRRKLTAGEIAAYRAPFADRSRRLPTAIFPAEILASGPWLKTVEADARRFSGPVHFIWPDNDIAFRRKELAHWQEIFPRATVTHLARCGHFLWEDAPEDCIRAFRAFADA